MRSPTHPIPAEHLLGATLALILLLSLTLLLPHPENALAVYGPVPPADTFRPCPN